MLLQACLAAPQDKPFPPILMGASQPCWVRPCSLTSHRALQQGLQTLNSNLVSSRTQHQAAALMTMQQEQLLRTLHSIQQYSTAMEKCLPLLVALQHFQKTAVRFTWPCRGTKQHWTP